MKIVVPGNQNWLVGELLAHLRGDMGKVARVKRRNGCVAKALGQRIGRGIAFADHDGRSCLQSLQASAADDMEVLVFLGALGKHLRAVGAN